jgi:hypothetical protein
MMSEELELIICGEGGGGGCWLYALFTPGVLMLLFGGLVIGREKGYMCICVYRRRKQRMARWINRCDMIEARTYS